MCSPGQLPIAVWWKVTEGPLEWTTRTPSWAALTWLWTCSGGIQTPSSHSPRRVLCSSSQTAPGEKTGGRLGRLRTELLHAFPPFRTQKIDLTGCSGCRIPSSGHPPLRPCSEAGAEGILLQQFHSPAWSLYSPIRHKMNPLQIFQLLTFLRII